MSFPVNSSDGLNEWNHSHWDVMENTANYDTGTKTFLAVTYAVLFLTGIPGNILVLVLFGRGRGRNSVESPFNVANCLILSLATADLGSLLFYIPFYVVYDVLGSIWPFGLVMCKFVFSFTHLCVYASLGSMVAIAVERYRVTYHLHVSKTLEVIGAVIVWLTALILVIPQMIYLQLVEIEYLDEEDSSPVYACELVWPDLAYERLLHPIDFAVFYLCPLVFITVLYVKIISMLRRAIRRNVLNRRLVKQSRKVSYVLVVIVVVFALCVFPVHFLQLIRVFFYQYWLSLYIEWPWLFSVFSCLYFLTHAMNPLVYVLLHRKFRVQAVEVLRVSQVLSCGRLTEMESR